MSIKEPFVSISTSDETGRISSASSDLTIAMVIESDTGVIEDTLVSSVSELLDGYSFNSAVVETDSVTFKTAAKILQFSPLRVTRACKANVKSGKTDKNKIIYASEVYDPFTFGEQVSFTLNGDTEFVFKYTATSGDVELSSSDIYDLTTSLLEKDNNWVHQITGDELLINYIDNSVSIDSASGISSKEVNSNTISLNDSKSSTVGSNALYLNGTSYMSSTVTSGDYLGTVKTVPNLSKISTSTNPTYQDYLIGFQDYLESSTSGDLPIIAWNHLKGKVTGLSDYTLTLSYTDNSDSMSLIYDESSISAQENGLISSLDLLLVNSLNSTTVNEITTYYGSRFVHTVSSGDYSSPSYYDSSNIKYVPAKENEVRIGLTNYYSVDDNGTEVCEANTTDSTVIYNGEEYTYESTTYTNIVHLVDTTIYGTLSVSDAEDEDDISTITIRSVVLNNTLEVYGSGYMCESEGSYYYLGTMYNYSITNYVIPTVFTENASSITATKLIKYIQKTLGLEESNFVLLSNKLIFDSRYSRNLKVIDSYANTIETSGLDIEVGTTYTEYTLSFGDIEAEEEENIYFNIQPQTKNSDGVWENTVDSRTFYIGEYSGRTYEELIRLTTASLTYDDWKNQLISSMKDYYNVVDKSDGFLLLGDGNTRWEFTLGCSSDTSWTDWSMEYFEDDYNFDLNEASFVVFNKFPNTQAQSSFEVVRDEDDHEIFTITLKHGIIEKSYDISFVQDKVDGYGRQLYYDRVNSLSDYFYMLSLNGGLSTTVESISEVVFGNEIYIGTASASDFVQALDNFVWSEKGIYYNFLVDGCYSNVSYGNALINKAVDLYSEAFVSIPEMTDEDQINEYRDALGIDSWHGFLSCQWEKDTTLGNFVFNLNKQIKLLEKIVANKASGQEFAPPFHKNNGSVTGTCNNYFKSKSIREELLSKQVNVVNRDLRRDIDYYVLALTSQTADSDLSDLHNCMMVNAGAHQMDTILDQFIGEFNTEETRELVTTAVTRAVYSRLFVNQKYKPNEIKVVCNDTNNDDDIVESRYLCCDLYYKFEVAIRYVDAWQRVVSLTKDLSSVG